VRRQVIFYILESDIVDFMARLAEKLHKSKENALFLLKDPEEIRALDVKIWTVNQLSFVPHGSRFSIAREFMKDCGIWISDEMERENSPICLVHKQENLPSDINLCFLKVLDITDRISIGKKTNEYKNLGFVDFKVWEQRNSIWQQVSMSS
jgi:DNA polymerase IIIc chi subunit